MENDSNALCIPQPAAIGKMFFDIHSAFVLLNPLPNVAQRPFRAPRSGRPVITTRIRLATSQTVHAIAACADGSLWTDSVELLVAALAACLDELSTPWPAPSSTSRVRRPRRRLRGTASSSSTRSKAASAATTSASRSPADVINAFACTYRRRGGASAPNSVPAAISANPFLVLLRPRPSKPAAWS
jgi:hypothetical protein